MEKLVLVHILNNCHTFQPKHKHHDDFWSAFEEAIANTGLVSTIPSCIKELLTAVGYNSSFSLLNIDETKLNYVEEYIEENCRDLVETFKTYESRKPFSFLPGHRELIFGISAELARLQQNGPKRSKKNVQSNLNERDLRASLVNQVTNFADGLKLHHNWSNSIKNFELESTGNATYAKCSISCEICKSDITTRYDNHWKISNIFKHIRSHVPSKKNTVTTQETTQVETGRADDDNNADNMQSNYETYFVSVSNNETVKSDDLIIFDVET